jgi:hypothetical protein
LPLKATRNFEAKTIPRVLILIADDPTIDAHQIKSHRGVVRNLENSPKETLERDSS